MKIRGGCWQKILHTSNALTFDDIVLAVSNVMLVAERLYPHGTIRPGDAFNKATFSESTHHDVATRRLQHVCEEVQRTHGKGAPCAGFYVWRGF